MSRILGTSLLPLHINGQYGWHWTDFVTACLLLLAVAGLAIAVTARRARQ